jgi:hypothetical protein
MRWIRGRGGSKTRTRFTTRVIKRRTNPDQRIIGFVLHAEPIVVSDGPNGDWAFIELYREKID